MTFPHSRHWWTEITLLRFTDSQGKKERRFYDKQYKSSRVTFLYLYIRNQECTTTYSTKNFFVYACVSRSSHIIIYMFTAFITTLQYNHIVTVWHVVSLLLYAYVNLLWCDSGEGEWLYSPSFNSYILKSLQKCNKVPPKHHHIKHTHSYIHTHEHRYVHTILYGRSIWNINFCGNAATQVKRGARKTKNLARWLSHHEKIFAYEIFFSEAKILDLFQCVSKMHTYE